ncbi:hypothetical protein N431DRAFT_434789 [Stipitochalara longipes BDJ]|nr:hypothetical protein N431DRAFT_434789 [Stipitochalara longipes BDJ]
MDTAKNGKEMERREKGKQIMGSRLRLSPVCFLCVFVLFKIGWMDGWTGMDGRLGGVGWLFVCYTMA